MQPCPWFSGPRNCTFLSFPFLSFFLLYFSSLVPLDSSPSSSLSSLLPPYRPPVLHPASFIIRASLSTLLSSFLFSLYRLSLFFCCCSDCFFLFLLLFCFSLLASRLDCAASFVGFAGLFFVFFLSHSPLFLKNSLRYRPHFFCILPFLSLSLEIFFSCQLRF